MGVESVVIVKHATFKVLIDEDCNNQKLKCIASGASADRESLASKKNKSVVEVSPDKTSFVAAVIQISRS